MPVKLNHISINYEAQTKAPERQKLEVFSTLFIGKNKLKQRKYIRTKLRLEQLNKRENLIQKR